MPKSKRRERSGLSFRRRPPTRTPNVRILIVAEGEKTEVNYFEAIRRETRLSTADVQVVPSA
jgi:hypothetical protein